MAGVHPQHFCAKSSLLSPSKSNSRRPLASSYRPMTVTMSLNESYWASINAEIEAHLKKAIPIRQPLTVFKTMQHLTLAAPRTTAQALCVAACELVGGHRDQAMAAALALHLVHSAAHTHEHLSLTDGPTNSGPQTHHAFGPNIELLIGDGIVPFGFELLAKSCELPETDSARVLRVITEIARAIGSQGIVEGQYQEIQYNQSNSRDLNDAKWAEHVCKKKDGEMHSCGAACGAILGGGNEEEIERLRKYGLYVGMIQGIMARNEKTKAMERVESLRKLALKELEIFNSRKAEKFSGLVEGNLCNV